MEREERDREGIGGRAERGRMDKNVGEGRERGNNKKMRVAGRVQKGERREGERGKREGKRKKEGGEREKIKTREYGRREGERIQHRAPGTTHALVAINGVLVELHHDGAARSRGLFGVQTTPVSLSLPGGAFTSARHGCGGQAGCPWGRW
jgi:hypothetical protein